MKTHDNNILMQSLKIILWPCNPGQKSGKILDEIMEKVAARKRGNKNL
jgi:hypothetical protein